MDSNIESTIFQRLPSYLENPRSKHKSNNPEAKGQTPSPKPNGLSRSTGFYHTSRGDYLSDPAGEFGERVNSKEDTGDFRHQPKEHSLVDENFESSNIIPSGIDSHSLRDFHNFDGYYEAPESLSTEDASLSKDSFSKEASDNIKSSDFSSGKNSKGTIYSAPLLHFSVKREALPNSKLKSNADSASSRSNDYDNGDNYREGKTANIDLNEHQFAISLEDDRPNYFFSDDFSDPLPDHLREEVPEGSSIHNKRSPVIPYLDKAYFENFKKQAEKIAEQVAVQKVKEQFANTNPPEGDSSGTHPPSPPHSGHPTGHFALSYGGHSSPSHDGHSLSPHDVHSHGGHSSSPHGGHSSPSHSGFSSSSHGGHSLPSHGGHSSSSLSDHSSPSSHHSGHSGFSIPEFTPPHPSDIIHDVPENLKKPFTGTGNLIPHPPKKSQSSGKKVNNPSLDSYYGKAPLPVSPNSDKDVPYHPVHYITYEDEHGNRITEYHHTHALPPHPSQLSPKPSGVHSGPGPIRSFAHQEHGHPKDSASPSFDPYEEEAPGFTSYRGSQPDIGFNSIRGSSPSLNSKHPQSFSSGHKSNNIGLPLTGTHPKNPKRPHRGPLSDNSIGPHPNYSLRPFGGPPSNLLFSFPLGRPDFKHPFSRPPKFDQSLSSGAPHRDLPPRPHGNPHSHQNFNSHGAPHSDQSFRPHSRPHPDNRFKSHRFPHVGSSFGSPHSSQSFKSSTLPQSDFGFSPHSKPNFGSGFRPSSNLDSSQGFKPFSGPRLREPHPGSIHESGGGPPPHRHQPGEGHGLSQSVSPHSSPGNDHSNVYIDDPYGIAFLFGSSNSGAAFTGYGDAIEEDGRKRSSSPSDSPPLRPRDSSFSPEVPPKRPRNPPFSPESPPKRPRSPAFSSSIPEGRPRETRRPQGSPPPNNTGGGLSIPSVSAALRSFYNSLPSVNWSNRPFSLTSDE